MTTPWNYPQIPSINVKDHDTRRVLQPVKERLDKLSKAVTDLIATGASGPTGTTEVSGSRGLTGATGPTGPTGATGPADISNVTAVNVSAGQPVYADQITGQYKLADASVPSRASVVGLITTTTLATFVVTAEQLQITLANWTAVVGSASLTVGQIYYLGLTAGTLTTTAPSTPGQALTRVGVALTSQKMDIAIQAPIFL